MSKKKGNWTFDISDSVTYMLKYNRVWDQVTIDECLGISDRCDTNNILQVVYDAENNPKNSQW